MPQLSTSQARVIDPILTTVAQGYQNAEFVGTTLFPYVPVAQRGGKILQFNREDFRLYATGRAPGAATKRVQYGFFGAPFALEQHSLEGMVPYELMEEASAVPGIDMGSGAVRKTQNIIGLRTEKAQADIATNAALYAAANKVTLAGTSKWSDYTNNVSDPTGDISTGVEAIRKKVGKRGNTVLLSAQAFNAAKNNPKILDRIKYTGRDSITPDMLANLWQVKRLVVGDAVYDDGANLVDVWGNFAIVAYTDLATAADMGTPSYGYTYRLGGFPIVEAPYQDRNAKSWIYPVTDEVMPVAAAIDAGYLITGPA